MTGIATLSERGQIVIPLEVRKKMHLEAGNKFAVFPIDNTVILKKIDLPSLERWDELLKPLREEAARRELGEKGIDRMVEETRREK